mgnify:CR=1 FL=1
MREKNLYTSNSNINNPEHDSDMYISENERLFGDNFATSDYYKRRMENNKKREKLNYRQNQFLAREKRRWERMDYEYLKQENIDMMNKEKNIVGRKNKPEYAFNLVNSRYDQSIQGEMLKKRDEESNFRAWLRSLNIDKRSNSGFNIINGQERTIFEKKLNHDVVPRLIKKNINQINEMKNKIFVNNNNFYTRCNTISHDSENGRYGDNYNNNYNRNRINKSVTTSNLMNDNGGRYRVPINLRDQIYNYNNENNAKKNTIIQSLNKNYNDFNNNYIITQENAPYLQYNINPNINDININNMNIKNNMLSNDNINMKYNNNLIKDNHYSNNFETKDENKSKNDFDDNQAIISNQNFMNNNPDNKYIMNNGNINQPSFPHKNIYNNNQNLNDNKRNLIINIPQNNIGLSNNVNGGRKLLYNRSITGINEQNNYKNPYNNNLYISS